MKRGADTLKVALVGNPNSGKTSLFNQLTGLHQKVGNFPGITVEKKSGQFRIEGSGSKKKVALVDLPGTYSLQPRSLDEKVAASVITDSSNSEHPDLVLLVVDALHLKTNLYLVLQVLETGIPCILVLNMADELAKSGTELNLSVLSDELGIPVLLTNARDGKGIIELKTAVAEHDLNPVVSRPEWVSAPKHTVIRQLLNRAQKSSAASRSNTTERIDDFLTHRFWGVAFFIFLLGLMFQSIYSWAAYPMAWIEAIFASGATFFLDVLPDVFLTRLLVEGVWAGLGGVVVFIPQIAFLFLFVALLEQTGYMARVSFIADGWLRKFGLQGRSIVPLIGGVACAVPAIMAARTISDPKERLLTILITPFMSCSARLPVYTLLIALVIPDQYLFGVFGYQALTLLIMYLLGVVAALGFSLVLNRMLKTEKESHFLMELPDYRLPKVSNVLLEISRKVGQFVMSAGKIIVVISVVLWLGASYGPPERISRIEEKYGTAQEHSSAKEAELLENSYIGILGTKLDPIIQPLGYDWKIGIALITSFAAREVFVGTMATIFSVGDGGNAASIKEKMRSQKDPETGKPLYGLPFGLSLLVFYAFAMQCMSTIAVVKAETGTWKWPIIQLLVMTGLAYVSSLAVYNLASIFAP
ncbi:MAG: ferrous iron transporter B [Flavobacteriales bacterium]|nr:ferrous iron transporter B [Flavobacteriales bacterium]